MTTRTSLPDAFDRYLDLSDEMKNNPSTELREQLLRQNKHIQHLLNQENETHSAQERERI